MLPILNQSLWRDEAFSLLLAEKGLSEIVKLAARDTTPPLYYLLLHYWMLFFGNSEIAARSLSVLFHALTAVVVFFIARRLVQPLLVQILLALAVFLNPFLLQYAFEARAYSLLVLWTVLAVYLALTQRNILAGMAWALGILTHNFAVFNFAAFTAGWLYTNKDKLNVKEGWWVLGIPILSILLWGSVIWNQWTRVAEDFWIKPSTSSIFLHSFEQYTKGDLFYRTQPILYTFSLILVFFGFSYWVGKQRVQESNKTLPLLFSLLILPTFITYLISAFFAPIYHERYLIATVPILILTVGYSLHKLYRTNIGLRGTLITLVIAYTVLLIQSSGQIVATTTKPAINYGVNEVLTKVQEGDVIIPQSNLNFLETLYYVEKSGQGVPVYAYSSNGEIPFYIGGVLFEGHVINKLPTDKRIWRVSPDGGHELLEPGEP